MPASQRRMLRVRFHPKEPLELGIECESSSSRVCIYLNSSRLVSTPFLALGV